MTEQNNACTMSDREFLAKYQQTAEDGSKFITAEDVFPRFFAKSQKFSKEEYFKEVVRICPELKDLPEGEKRSQEDIENYISKIFESKKIVGGSSIRLIERRVGAKIGEDYKYPYGVTDVEYEYFEFMRYGFMNYSHKTDESIRESCYEVEPQTGQKQISKSYAYFLAWRKLHYNDTEKMLKQGKAEWNVLCELNPQLKELQFDKNNPLNYRNAINGVIYSFPIKDIELFVNSRDEYVFVGERNRIFRETHEEGLEDLKINWVASSDTIKKIGKANRAAKEQMKRIIKDNQNIYD